MKEPTGLMHEGGGKDRKDTHMCFVFVCLFFEKCQKIKPHCSKNNSRQKNLAPTDLISS